MRNRYAAAAAAGCLLAVAGGTFAYSQQVQTIQPASTVAARVPMDRTVRELAKHRASVSAKVQKRHAAATAAHRAAARQAARRAAQVPVGQPCDGDPGSWHVWQPDGTCGGLIHRGGGGYYDNDGKPCPGTSPCTDDSGYQDDNTSNDPLIKKCPSGAATSLECDELIKHRQPNMQPPKCGDGSTPAYLRAHGLHCR